jgi:hypothetical protein
MFDREEIRWECCTAFYEEHQKTSEVINSNGRDGWTLLRILGLSLPSLTLPFLRRLTTSVT